MIFLQSQAADDGSDLIHATPADFMQRLEAREQKSSEIYQNGSFVLRQYYKNGFAFDGFSLKNAMEKCGVGPYGKYLVRLAASTALRPEEKLEKCWINIPPFTQLSDDKERSSIIENCLKNLSGDYFFSNDFYPVKRIVLAPLLLNKEVITSHQGAYLLCEAATHDDVFMIQRLLELNVDPNVSYVKEGRFIAHHPIAECKSSQAVQLMINHNADVNHLESVLSRKLENHLHEPKSEKSKELLHYLIETISLSESNGFGLSYMQEMADRKAQQVDADQLCIYLRMLLEQGFACDSDTKNKICGLAAEKSAEAREEIKQVFEQCENKGKDIKG